MNDKVDTLSKSVEDNQERTRKNEQAIAEIDQKVGQVDQKAAGRGHGGGRRQHAPPTSAGAKADAVDKASKRLIYEVTLSEDQGGLQVRQGGAAGRGQGAARRDRQRS